MMEATLGVISLPLVLPVGARIGNTGMIGIKVAGMGGPAMARSEFGEELHRLIGCQWLSMRELARRIPMNPGQLSRIINGKRLPGHDLARRCDEILDSVGSLLAGVTGGRLLELAYRYPQLAAPAAESIENAIVLRPAGILRASALDHFGLAEARLIQGELDEAVRVGHSAVGLMEQTSSRRAAVHMQQLVKALNNAPSTRSTEELRDRIASLDAT